MEFTQETLLPTLDPRNHRKPPGSRQSLAFRMLPFKYAVFDKGTRDLG